MANNIAVLRPFQTDNAQVVLSWIKTAEELWQWAARKDFPLLDINVFQQWRADPDVTPLEYLVNGDLLGYGELWCEPEDSWAELARIVIAPSHRSRGHGRLLVSNLLEKVRQLGFTDAWLRVCPTNESALRCYLKAGFIQVPEHRQAELNADQPHDYVWMRRALETSKT